VKLIIGLGNPGAEYARTRHNIGWLALDRVGSQCGIKPTERRFGGLLGHRGDLWLLKPLTYMNYSGKAVSAALAGLGVALQDCLVLVDDLNLPLGALRMRAGGSSGGHRGLDSIVRVLGTDGFPRLRMGIGPVAEGKEAREFVLSEFEEEELPAVEELVGRAAEAALCWKEDGIDAAMNAYNRAAGPLR